MISALKSKYRILSTSAFTLIELLVVISIIGILTTLVAANLNSARSRARDAERKSDLKNISTALRLYFNDNGSYPPISGDIPWGEAWNGSGSTVYMNSVPQDPLFVSSGGTSPNYLYELGSPTDTFTLTACLENSSDKQGVTTLNTNYDTMCTKSHWMFQIIVQ